VRGSPQKGLRACVPPALVLATTVQIIQGLDGFDCDLEYIYRPWGRATTSVVRPVHSKGPVWGKKRCMGPGRTS